MLASTLLIRAFPYGTSQLARRLVQLYAGLVLYGFSAALLVLAGLGLDPWDVFHQGLARHSSLAIGTWVIIISAVVLLLWIPLRQMPGLGTVSNALLVGAVMNATLSLLSSPSQLPVRAALLLAGVLLNGVATGAYIGAGMGPGPRDGLMTGLAKRGLSLRVARTGIELTVLAAGFLLGGSVGIGTVLYALSIGPLSHFFLPLLAIDKTSVRRTQSIPGGQTMNDPDHLISGQLDQRDGRWQLRFKRTLPHPPETVWRALTEPEHLAAWFPTEIQGERVAGAPLRFVFRKGEGPSVDGRMIAYDPPSVLEFCWGDETLRFDLESGGEGTALTFVNTFDELGKAARDAAGWHVCLDLLGYQLDDTEAPGNPREHWKQAHASYVALFGPEAATIGPPVPVTDPS